MDDLISRQWLMECIDEGWIRFDTEKDANTYIHLVRDIAPSAQPEVETQMSLADCISRQAAIDAFNEYDDTDLIKAKYVRQTLAKLPSAQPEIVRCKDCKYCEHWYADKGRCFLWHEGGIDVFEEGFCNYAERRTDG